MHILINGLCQLNLRHHQMNGPDTAMSKAIGTIGYVIVDVTGGEHRFVIIWALKLAKTIFNSALASGRVLVSTFLTHSKCLRALKGVVFCYAFYTQKRRNFECFLHWRQ